MSVLVLRPGEMSGTAVSDTPAPLGSVLVLEAADADPHLATMADAQQHSPWMPLAIVGSDDAAARLQHTLRLIIGPVGAVHLSGINHAIDLPTAIREAVRKRPVRLPGDVEWYCRRRMDLACPELVRAAVAWQRGWSEAGVAREVEVNPATLSRNCRQCFGMSWPLLVGLGCWEAVIEQGIRSDGHALSQEADLIDSDNL